MQITATQLGKRFQREWIFRKFDYTFSAGQTYALTGPNGSGKSTMLQTLAGVVPATEGKITYGYASQKSIPDDDIYQHISIAAPYLELIEEFTLKELLDFHWQFKSLRAPILKEQLLDRIQLSKAQHKAIRHFSSGMKQRLKLALALFADTPVLLLDEPTTNMDTQGIDWYRAEIAQHLSDRLVIICSNQRYEYDFCEKILLVTDYRE